MLVFRERCGCGGISSNLCNSVPYITYVIRGVMRILKRRVLIESEWQAVTDENRTDMRFFKVEIVLP